jgi:hypothetical protein
MKTLLITILILIFSLTVLAQVKSASADSVQAQTKLNQLELQRQSKEKLLIELRGKYKEEHPSIQKVKAEIAAIDKEINSLYANSTTAEPQELLTEQEADILSKLLMLNLAAANCGFDYTKPKCKAINSKLTDVYTQVARSPKLTRAVTAEAVNKYQSIRPQTKSAPQFLQITDEQNIILMRFLAAQIQRIIELLEKHAKDK